MSNHLILYTGAAMNYDPANLSWGTPADEAARGVPSLKGHDIAHADLPTPPAEVWGKLRFRPWRDADAPLYAGLLSDPEMWRYLPLKQPGQIDAEHAAHLIAVTKDRSRHLVRAVLLNNQPVGQVRLHWQGSPKPLSTAEIDYWLARSAHGAGIGSRMVALFLWQALRDFPQLQLVTIVIHKDNGPSRALARRLGFVEAGPKEPGSPWLQGCITRQAASRIDWGSLALRQARELRVKS